MKIMTFNLRCDSIFDLKNRWKNRKHIVNEIMSIYDCDIIGTQELTNKMYKDILKETKQYNIIGKLKRSSLFQERNDLLINKKHRVIEHKTFWLSKTPWKKSRSTWYSVFPRICNTALIELENKNLIRVYNTHLDCFFETLRKYQLNKIMDYIEIKDKEENVPILLMGDFNAEPNSSLIRNFLCEKFNGKILKPVQEYNTKIYKKSTMSNFNGNKNGTHIDYIFVSQNIEIHNVDIINYNINGKYPSDHYPLMAEIKIR